MINPDKSFFLSAIMQKDVYPKALASFMFREIIEDAHAKYNISQEDMETMCRNAVNRAAVFIAIKTDPLLYKAFAIHAIYGLEWDESVVTPELREYLDNLAELARSIDEEATNA